MSIEITIGDDHLKALEGVAEAASDYALAIRDSDFAEQTGGVDFLREILLQKTREWESFMSSISED